MTDLESRLRAALHDETADLAAPPELADAMVTRGASARRRRRVVGGAAGLVVLAALVPVWRTIDTSSGSTPPAHHPTVVSPRPTTPTTPPTTQKAPLPPWSVQPVDVVNRVKGQTSIIGVRTARHAGYDRWVIDLAGAIPSYHIGTTAQLVFDPSGEPASLPGEVFLAVRLTPATGHTDTGSLTVDRRKHLLAMPTLLGYQRIGDNEGVVSFGLGLSQFDGYRVFELTAPHRLVIDVRH